MRLRFVLMIGLTRTQVTGISLCLSVQQRCQSTAPVPDDQRQRAVLALSKESGVQ